MVMARARNNLKSARRNLADAIDVLPKSIFSKTRSKRNKIKQAIDTIDKTIETLKGL